MLVNHSFLMGVDPDQEAGLQHRSWHSGRIPPAAHAAVTKLHPPPKMTYESQSKPGTKMVCPEPCKELRRRPQLFLAGTAPCQPSSTRALIVAHISMRNTPKHLFERLDASRPLCSAWFRWRTGEAGGMTSPEMLASPNGVGIDSPTGK